MLLGIVRHTSHIIWNETLHRWRAKRRTPPLPHPAASYVDFAQLEDRVLYSAVPAAALLLGADGPDGSDPGEPLGEADLLAAHQLLATMPEQADPATDPCDQPHPAASDSPDQPHIPHELILIDASVQDWRQLADELLTGVQDQRHIDLVTLDSNRDGIDQIREVLAGHDDLDAVHIISHGNQQAVKLGSAWLSFDNVGAYADRLADWGGTLGADGDLLVYACDLAEGHGGRALADTLAQLTQADVAVSIDATGHAVLGGDWQLEYATGDIETAILTAGHSPDSWFGLLTEPANHAPELHVTTMAFRPTPMGEPDPPGETVADLIASAGVDCITDTDSQAMEGLAVIGVHHTSGSTTGPNGEWEYSTDGGTNWERFDSPSETSAVLLEGAARIRFVPSGNYLGPAGYIEFRAWDHTSGDSGDVGVDVSSNGGTTAFSAQVGAATLNVNRFTPGVIEGAATGTVVGVIPIDISGTEVYTLTNDAGGRFALGSAGLLSVADGPPLDHETASTHEITVAITGAGGTTHSETFIVPVIDVNDNAPDITASQRFFVAEDAAGGTPLGHVLATDPDTVGQLQQWTILSGNEDGVFQIHPATGLIHVAQGSSLDYESRGQYTLQVQVSDGFHTSAPETVMIDVIDVNDPPVAVYDKYEVGEGGVVLVLDGADGVLANDTDADGDTLTARLINGPLHGDAKLLPNGTFYYKPDVGFVGVDRFAYVARDGNDESGLQLVLIEVPAPILPPKDEPTHDSPGADDTPPSGQTPGSGDPPQGQPLGDGYHDLPRDLLGRQPAGSHQETMEPARSAPENPVHDAYAVEVEESDPGRDADPEGTLVRDDMPTLGGTSYVTAGLSRLWQLSSPALGVAAAINAPLVEPLATTLDAGFLRGLDSTMEVAMADVHVDNLTVGAVGMITMGLSVGYVYAALRFGHVLMSSLLATVPVWKFVDPLPVLTYLDGLQATSARAGQDEGDSLESIVQRVGQRG